MGAATISAVDELDERIQSLPQELQDLIKEGLIAVPAGLIKIDPEYKPPIGLQLDHKTRERFAKEYYKDDAVYHIPGAQFRSCTQPYFPLTRFDAAYKITTPWLIALDRHHRQFLETVLFELTWPIPIHNGTAQRMQEECEHICFYLSDDVVFRPGIITIKMSELHADGTITTTTCRNTT